MKKLLIFCLLALTACSLKEQSYTSVDKNNYLNDADEAETLLLGVYQAMCVDGIYKFHLSMLLSLPTDEAKVEGSSLVGFREQASNAYTSADSYVQATWAALYTAIYRANDFLESMKARMDNFSGNDLERCRYYIAEARALRGLYYFELVRWFKNVPLIRSTAESYNLPSEFKQEKPENVYKFIEEDLKYAAEVLPWHDEDSVRGNVTFRLSKGGVLGLLAKVYATWAGYPLQDNSKWALAAKAAGEVVNGGHHKLLANYEQLWKNAANNVWAPEESLLEACFYAPQPNTASSGRIGKWNGANATLGAIKGNYNQAVYKVHPTFLTGWKDHSLDKRWGLSFADYRYTKGTNGETVKETITSATIGGEKTPITFEMAMDTGYPGWRMDWRRAYSYMLTPAKWDIERYVEDANQIADNNLSNVNWYVLRYADVLLLYAEALAESGGSVPAEAVEAVNQVRRRGFGEDQNTPSDKADLPIGIGFEDFRQAVRDERSYELAFEGHRRQDLVRWGIYYETVMDTYLKSVDWHEAAPQYFIGALYTVKGKNELLPIPLHDIDLCGFEQNDKW
ncbi:MAG: RagB/SusD family nutrient uptake outer membrane protein [Bacteroidales bacterium]|nr:RagB/SusD family nutrient uptake outer membrane protein [Bacteroidales bacterium]